MFFPDESTLAGRLCALASTAELGLLAAEYQQKQQKQQKRRRRKGSRDDNGIANPMDDDDLWTAMESLVSRKSNTDLSTLMYHRLAAAELSGFGTSLMVVCLNCYKVTSNYSIWRKVPDFCSNECEQEAERARQRTGGSDRQRHYLRLGMWDTATEKSIDFQTGMHEPGVSVYDAFYDPEGGCYRLDTLYVSQYARRAKIYMTMLFDRHMYIVTGEEMDPGGDGEPCLRNVRLIAPAIWRNHRIVPIPLERLLWLAEALGFTADAKSR